MAKRIRSRPKLVCKNHRAWFWQNKTGPLPVSRTRFSSVHFKVVSLRWKSLSLYMLPPVSQKFPQRCLRRFRSTVGHRRLGSCRAKPAQILSDRVEFWPNGSSPEARRCQCKNHRARFRQNKTVPLPVSLTRFSSVHFKVVSMRWKSLSLYVLPPLSRKFPQRCL